MGLVVRLYDIVSPNKFKLNIGLSPYGSFTQITNTGDPNGEWLPSTSGTTSSTHRNYRTDPICITNDDPPISGSTCFVYTPLEFDTRYFLKLQDTFNVVDNCETSPCINGSELRHIIESIYISDSKTFDCYDKINFDVDYVCITPTPTPNPTGAPNPTSTPFPTASPNPTSTPNKTPGPTSTPNPTPTPNPTGGHTPTPYPTSTPNKTPGPTSTPNPTANPTPTPTPNPTSTPNPTPTAICVEVSDFVARSDHDTTFTWEDCDGNVFSMTINLGDAAPPSMGPCVRSGTVTWTPSGGDARVDLVFNPSGLCE